MFADKQRLPLTIHARWGLHIESAEPRSLSSRFYIFLHDSYRTSSYLSFDTYFFTFITIFEQNFDKCVKESPNGIIVV